MILGPFGGTDGNREAVTRSISQFTTPQTRMPKVLFATVLLGILLLPACSAPETLPDGRWTGSLTPMNHPEMRTPLSYTVSHPDGVLAISMDGPGGEGMPFINPVFELGSLSYAFIEPEGGNRLRCRLDQQPDATLEGRCTDPSGKWALFRMVPPEQ